MRAFLLAFAMVFVVGCGYKHTSSFIKQSVGESVFVFVEMYASDPENTVAIKDAVNEAVITKFRSKMAPIEKAKTKMYIKIGSVSLSPIQYDSKGYVILYKMTVSLSATISKTGEKPTTASGSGSYDFSVEPGSTLSEEKRFTAIQNSASKAIDMLISQISIKGMVEDDNRSISKQINK